MCATAKGCDVGNGDCDDAHEKKNSISYDMTNICQQSQKPETVKLHQGLEDK